MTTKDLEQIVKKSITTISWDAIKLLIQPSIEIEKTDSNVHKTGDSKLGGLPDVPLNFVWPSHHHHPYRFIAQFNLTKLATHTDLPSNGLLSVFVADTPEKEYFWGDDGYAKVFWFDNSKKLSPCQHPQGFQQPFMSIKLVPSVALPLREDLIRNSLLSPEQMEELQFEILERQCKEMNHLLGYPFFSTLAYDPRPDETWVSLLNLASIQELDWCWHDGDFLMLFIEKEKLAKGDFSNIQSDAG